MNPVSQTLRARLADWSDIDAAAFSLAVALGLMEPDIWQGTKHVFWSASPVGAELINMLNAMVRLGILEYREDPADYQYRWNKAFKGSWEP